ncbi:hypothetical protein EV175_003409, partial [Coemansia sp. RSA 1933]
MSKEPSTGGNPNIEADEGSSIVEDFTGPVHTDIAAAINQNVTDMSSDNRNDDTDAIDAASRKAFGSVALFLQSELEASGSEISLLEKLNDASISKYEELSCQAQDMLVHAYKIKQTYNEMEAQMAEVDSLVVSIDNLEQVAQ